jgi:hypothetical protein
VGARHCGGDYCDGRHFMRWQVHSLGTDSTPGIHTSPAGDAHEYLVRSRPNRRGEFI